MKRKRFTDEQTVAVLREHEAGRRQPTLPESKGSAISSRTKVLATNVWYP
jgi:hypothetical protein